VLGLELKPLEAFLPEALRIAGEKRNATGSCNTNGLGEQAVLVYAEGGDSVLDTYGQIEALTLKAHLRRVHGSQVNRLAVTHKFRRHSQTVHRRVNSNHTAGARQELAKHSTVTAPELKNSHGRRDFLKDKFNLRFKVGLRSGRS